MTDVYHVDRLMSEARRLAAEYRRATGKTLAISGEIAVNDAIQLLKLRPAEAEVDAYDALGGDEVGADAAGPVRYLIKARVVFDDKRRPQRLGQLKLDRDWDVLLLVLMNEDYEPDSILAASRVTVEQALDQSSPNRRGTLSVGRMRHISRVVWQRDGGAVESLEF